MKKLKLKLKLQSIEGSEILTREQLKTVMGGSGSGGGEYCQTDGFVCWQENGNTYTCFETESACCCGHDKGNRYCYKY